ncbi:hypothetical protein AGMMS50268_18220 [Spirochaetia bacterium]|nr:hypothetical protein AGMMS50268_18220 [Spirochaetia bacterium]
MLQKTVALILIISCLCPAGWVFAQDGTTQSRGTIPEDLMRPQRGEAARYPSDTVIGVLGQGEASGDAYRFARDVLSAFVAESRGAKVLSAMDSASLDILFSSLGRIKPLKFRLGGGREEADGGISFLVRFMGREQGIAGELYIRRGNPASGPDGGAGAEGEAPPWQFDDLILEIPLSLDERQEGPSFDLPPYERFF